MTPEELEQQNVLLRAAQSEALSRVEALERRLQAAKVVEVQRDEAWRRLDELESLLERSAHDKEILRRRLAKSEHESAALARQLDALKAAA